ncbi:hypothetical protein [Microbispora sp. H13382]|uniref:hypothetical protein n=1 Tax=Microbispora sp. H13382 TaxID=2729112 RepID=UPI001C727F91|nr:hypothetical protein [Microbispora sp. H13382]
MGDSTTTGGAAGATVTVTTYADLVKYATASEPYTIRVNGTITATPYGTELKVASNKTIVGVGTKGHIVNGGFFLGSGVWGATKMVLENSYFDNVKDPYYKDDAAQLKQSGSIVVNCSGQQESGGSAFTPSSFYSYTLDPAADVPSLVKTYAGPQANIGL